MTVQVTLSAKQLDPMINYNFFDKSPKNEVFHYKNLIEEVKNLPKKKKIKYAKICLATLTTLASISILGIPTFAETIPLAVEVTTQTGQILPKDIVDIGKYLIGICAAIGFVLAIILYQLAGGLRMLRKRKEATEWSSDILKGFFQILVAPVLIVTIALVCYLLFSGIPFFTKPF